MKDALTFLQDYLRYPSISADPSQEKGMAAAREHIVGLLEKLGFTIEIVAPPPLLKNSGHPIILAKRLSKIPAPRILLYGHYDVQPADPLDLWESPPFEPQIRQNRLYARGAADNKGPHVAMLYGLAKALEKNPDLNLSLTLLLEGEEEIGSPSVPTFLEKYKEELKADFILLSDTCSPSTHQIAVTTGLRGVCTLELTVIGPKADLHSGLHGGAVHNPIQVLADLCSSLHNQDGSVNVPGFYDDVKLPLEWEREDLKRFPISTEEYSKSVGVSSLVSLPGYTPQECTRFLPTLEFNGITGGYQGPGSKTIIPHKASVKISCRLVPNQNNEKIIKAIQEALLERCPKTVRLNITYDTGGSPYFLLNPNKDKNCNQDTIIKKAFQVCENSIQDTLGTPPLFMREGGSIPIIGIMKDILGLEALMIGLFTPDDALHSPNESMDLSLFQKGIDLYASFFEKMAL